jgi:hypothetical protein
VRVGPPNPFQMAIAAPQNSPPPHMHHPTLVPSWRRPLYRLPHQVHVITPAGWRGHLPVAASLPLRNTCCNIMPESSGPRPTSMAVLGCVRAERVW